MNCPYCNKRLKESYEEPNTLWSVCDDTLTHTFHHRGPHFYYLIVDIKNSTDNIQIIHANHNIKDYIKISGKIMPIVYFAPEESANVLAKYMKLISFI